MKHTRLLAILMALCLLAAALPLASAEEEVITLTIARKTDTLIENLETNETTKAIEEKFGVKLKFLEYPSADAQAKLAVVMASKSNVPDIVNFELDYVTEYNYAMRGLLLPLNKYLADPSMTKNLDSRVDAEAKEALLKIVRMPDGNNYGLPSYEDAMWGRAWYHAWINQEWLDTLGLDMPKTTEDFRAVLEAFVSQDPNGNGVNDEIGLLGSTTSNDQKVVNFLLNAFTYADPNAKYFGVKDGEVYLLLAIPLAYIIIFHYVPIGGLQMAMKAFDLRYGIARSPWVGFRYFEKFLDSFQFSRILSNTLTLSFYSLFAGFPLPILLALLLNAAPHQTYKKLIQTVTYVPHFISTVVMVGILMQVFNMRSGVYGILYSAFTGSAAPDLFASSSAFRHMYVWSGIWQNLGWDTIIYLAALMNVDPELNEAAQIDGANRWQRMWHIDLPTILPTASILLILAAGKVMNVGFEKVYLMQNDLNISTSEVISTYVYKIGMVTGGGDFSYGTAIGLFNSVVNFILIILVNAVCKKLGGSSLW